MTTFGIIVDVMFAIYVVNLVSSFVHSFAQSSGMSEGARMWVDLAIGVILFWAVLNYGQPVSV